MIKQIFHHPIYFERVKGVGALSLSALSPAQRVYAFIGSNGIGKTKLLESLFATLFFSHESVLNLIDNRFVRAEKIPFGSVDVNGMQINIDKNNGNDHYGFPTQKSSSPFKGLQHSTPIVYLSAQQRGVIDDKPAYSRHIAQIGSKEKRLKAYIEVSLDCFSSAANKLKHLNMDVDIDEWIIQRAQSANPYQSKADNREVEIRTLLQLLHQIDDRISADFLEIDGDNRVFLEVEGHKRALSQLSSGFTSILKILQSIVAGYGNLTNEVNIQHVPGIVLIDEIESHLHNQWQVKILPLLKQLFPNTVFIVSSHSSLVISQLEEGEAYRLVRNDTGIVEAQQIPQPSQMSFIDLMQEAFNVDLNQKKVSHAERSGQKDAKQALLNLVQQELKNMGAQK